MIGLAFDPPVDSQVSLEFQLQYQVKIQAQIFDVEVKLTGMKEDLDLCGPPDSNLTEEVERIGLMIAGLEGALEYSSIQKMNLHMVTIQGGANEKVLPLVQVKVIVRVKRWEIVLRIIVSCSYSQRHDYGFQ